MKYEILESETAEGLKTQVALAMAEGWRLQGGVAFIRYERIDNRKGYVDVCYSYTQAMIRETDHAIK